MWDLSHGFAGSQRNRTHNSYSGNQVLSIEWNIGPHGGMRRWGSVLPPFSFFSSYSGEEGTIAVSGNGRLLFGVETVQRRIVREGKSKASFDDISRTYLDWVQIAQSKIAGQTDRLQVRQSSRACAPLLTSSEIFNGYNARLRYFGLLRCADVFLISPNYHSTRIAYKNKINWSDQTNNSILQNYQQAGMSMPPSPKDSSNKWPYNEVLQTRQHFHPKWIFLRGYHHEIIWSQPCSFKAIPSTFFHRETLNSLILLQRKQCLLLKSLMI